MTEWRKSSRSPTGNECVELQPQGNGAVWNTRDSKNPDGDVLTFGGAAWGAFMRTITS